MVTIVPQGGLGNRIRSIRAAARLANARGQKLKIIWINVCECGFGDIFHDIRGIKYCFEGTMLRQYYEDRYSIL